MKYKITITQIGESEHPLSLEMQRPLECDGFCILGNLGGTKRQARMHDISAFEVAGLIAMEERLKPVKKILDALEILDLMKGSAD